QKDLVLRQGKEHLKEYLKEDLKERPAKDTEKGWRIRHINRWNYKNAGRKSYFVSRFTAGSGT
ncbi:MAG: hypothetical protein NC091_10820, partial [Bacteroides sp.]|nr:hypothetical protein [Bacteroides sp.]